MAFDMNSEMERLFGIKKEHTPDPRGREVYDEAILPQIRAKMRETVPQILLRHMVEDGQELAFLRDNGSVKIYTVDSFGKVWEYQLTKTPINELPKIRFEQASQYTIFRKDGSVEQGERESH